MAKKILLADDSITIQKVVELTFSDGDYEVVATNNGNKAIQRLAEWKPDIILSDIIMPEKNGYELCEYVKSHPDFRNIPVILLTGTFEPFDPDRAEKAGCDAVITKPFESQSLIHKVEELISAASGSSGVSKTQPVAAVTGTKDDDEGGALSGMEDSQTKAWPVPKLDMGWSAAKPEAAPPPAASKSPRSEEPAPKSSAFDEPRKEEPRAAASSKSSSPFDDGEDLSPAGGKSSSSAFQDEPMNAPSTPEAQFDFSGATKAFPKMNFEELQSLSGSSSDSKTPEPPAPSSWSSAPPKAASPDWDSRGVGAGAPPSMKTEESPFGDELPEPESSPSESIFSSTPSPSGFGSAPSPAGFGSSPSPTGFGSSPSSSPSSSGSSSSSPAGFASPMSPSSFGSSAASPTKTPEVAMASSSKSDGEPAAPAGKSDLSEEQIDKIARRVVELMSEQVVRNIAWEVIPDLAEMVVRERIRQLESEN
jgi:CheY-like chemotaxis protein